MTKLCPEYVIKSDYGTNYYTKWVDGYICDWDIEYQQWEICSQFELIGSNVSVKQYNKFLTHKAPRGYKYQRKENENVFVIDMSNSEHSYLVGLLYNLFKLPNDSAVLNPTPINIHFSPALNGGKIAPDLSITPSLRYIPISVVPHPLPLPSDTTLRWQITSLMNHKLKCQLWLQESYVRYVFGIKLYKPKKAKYTVGKKYRAMTTKL
ncbi:hypothetical protein Glove_194g31 [Diversispora epigaea]|uniref:Uncharacterized protein n=1 Tax=Diversispora epigaea TaxID=1348612 RepID=A0A397ILE0_9GLOM|nr:hypothetical protein Glove_194g31 [Diversispora epigaea]